MRKTSRLLSLSALLFCFYLCFSSLCLAEQPSRLSRGQDIYIPAYSHIYHGNKESPLLLSVTLSIRNIDPKNSIEITTVDYYETEGALVKKYISKPLALGPLGSERFVVPQKDNTGGSGANFIVTWKALEPTNPPIVETVMIGTQSQLGISFTSRGQPLE
ncbi:DUF3124 domain-containing protein [Desulforhopalus sp. IMCC35007]|uniref:DUF3124 domain-containing protein n=1 Tax=Desulforhopalus sp. IMCC35007 TaxID=2569543 RepID=UPI0010AE9F30|nr:DUF3124 domain-containing protein [Desulforhopalus sp. IMCC35007]TKB10052.1 DUF3124 domain-containing protein [Desulforhopalus sp. IMCC35007]